MSRWNMTLEKKREIQILEKNAMRDARSWKRHVSKKLNSISPVEQVKYLNGRAAKVCAEHGIKFSSQ
jgi:hypothetical protein